MGKKLRIGVMMTLNANVREELDKVAALGLDNCQLNCWDPSQYTEERVAQVNAAVAEFGLEITSLWTGYSGPAVWNFIDGPSTIGLVPPGTRAQRVQELIAGAEFAAKINVKCTSTHAGFIPENPKDPEYAGTVDALRQVAQRCKDLGLGFAFETGQETPTALMRAITDIGTGNLGINLDPANLLMYGKANPVDALDILGPHLLGIHAKDGDYPKDPMNLGPEMPLGEGKVDFPRFVAKAKAMGYEGCLTIEREISGEKQIADIKKAIELLTPLC